MNFWIEQFLGKKTTPIDKPDWAIVGLGNPGKKFENTRHNIGFKILEELARLENVEWKENKKLKSNTALFITKSERKILLVKPETFMNLSGLSVTQVMRQYKLAPESVCVVYDDISLPVGRIKLTEKGSAGGHNGVQDILSRIGECFKRLKIGIGSKAKEQDLADYVLGNFNNEEIEEINKVIPQAIDGLRLMIDKGMNLAMNSVNRKQKI